MDDCYKNIKGITDDEWSMIMKIISETESKSTNVKIPFYKKRIENPILYSTLFAIFPISSFLISKSLKNKPVSK